MITRDISAHAQLHGYVHYNFRRDPNGHFSVILDNLHLKTI